MKARPVRSYCSIPTAIAPSADRATCAAVTPVEKLLELGNRRPVSGKGEAQLLSADWSCL
ncbi:MAG: hypothetical protein JWR52_649 [Marmoricola sp.]|nr:hypothetical protein [Marmoricola sp.]